MTLAVAIGAMALITPAFASAAPDQGTDVADRGYQQAAKAAQGKAPSGPNPYLALVKDRSKLDFAGWDRALAYKSKVRAQQKAKVRANAGAAAQQPILHDEEEPAGIFGGNDTQADAEVVAKFGTAKGKNPKARILGQLSHQVVPVSAMTPNTEDDGAIPLARDTGIEGSRGAIRTTGTIGDGPHGSAGSGSGDFDFYKIEVQAGKQIVADVDGRGLADSIVEIWDADGNFLAGNDDENASTFDSLLRFTAPATGVYYVEVAGFLSIPEDPFDSGSGPGAGEEGAYQLTITSRIADVDYYSVPLRPGDVLGVTVKNGASHIDLYDPSGKQVMGSSQDASSIMPANTSLPGGGNALADHVAAVAGMHSIKITDGDGLYDVTVEAYRPPLEKETKPQTLFLDFDGQRLNTNVVGGPGVRTLSPFRAFLGRWGLTRADEPAVVKQVVQTVKENLGSDAVARNGKSKIVVRNSADNPDTFGNANVSRVVVGGTIAESGINTIGIAQSIDPGNFGHEETALVLLDAISDPAGPEYSLNTYLTPASNRIKFVGTAIGNIVSHEAGHYLGSWHTDSTNAVKNVMDEGGDFAGMYAVGPDNVGGTADDPDADLSSDVFSLFEGFTGTEDSLNRVAWGLSSK